MTPHPRILLLGAAGQLGSALHRTLASSADVLACDRHRADLTRTDDLRTLVRDTHPDVVLNAAAYTAVDRAESEPDLAAAVNAVAPRVLAEEAQRAHALLVHYSTDYVFDGSKVGAWTESDPTIPLNVYGATKLAGEEAIAEVGGPHLIFRTSWVYAPRGNNFLLSLLRLAQTQPTLQVVDDQIGAPTPAAVLAEATRSILVRILDKQLVPTSSWSGIYHMTCADSVSRFGFAEAIFHQLQSLNGIPFPNLIPIASVDYPERVCRPRNCILSNQKLHDRFEITLPAWPEALSTTMSQLPPPAPPST